MGFTNLRLIDFSEEDDNLIAFPVCDSLEDLQILLTFDDAKKHIRSESLKPRRLSFLRKSLDWDTAFFTTEGQLNAEELCKVNKGFKKAHESKQPTRKDVKTRRVSMVKPVGDPNSRSLNPQGLKGIPKTRIKDQKISTYNSEKNSKGSNYRLDGLSSSASSNGVVRKINPRITKPTTSPKSVLSPLSSTSSSSLSPARRFNNAISTTDFPSPLLGVCQNINEGKLTSSDQHGTKSSIRNMKSSSALKIPSPRLGFFDEKPLQPFNLSAENHPKVRKVSASCTKLKTDGEIHKGKSRSRLNAEGKVQKNDNIESIQMIGIKEKRDKTNQWSFQKSRKENSKQCSFEDQVNGLNRQLELLNLDSDVTNVGGQQSCSRPDQLSIPLTSKHTTTPCSRTPLAEKMLLTSDNKNKCDCIERFKGAHSHVQSESVEPRRLSLCRKSIEWDRAFFSNAGLLNAEELCMVHRGFKAVEPDQSSSQTTKHIRRHTVAGWNQTLLDGNGFHGQTLKGKVFKDVNPGHHPSSVTKTMTEQSQKSHYKTRLKLMTQRLKRSTYPKNGSSIHLLTI